LTVKDYKEETHTTRFHMKIIIILLS